MHHPIFSMLLSRLARKCCCASNLHLPYMQMVLVAIRIQEKCSYILPAYLLGESCAGSNSDCNGEQPAWLGGKLTRLAADAVTQGPSPALTKSSAVTSSTCDSVASQH